MTQTEKDLFMDLISSTTAVVALLVSHDIITQEEFTNTKAACLAHIDQMRAKAEADVLAKMPPAEKRGIEFIKRILGQEASP